MKKILTILLLVSMLASLASCGGGEAETAADTETTASETTAAEEVDPLEARRSIADDLPEKDFGGVTYTIMSDEPNYLMDNCLDIEESTGEVVDDAVFSRNTMVEERFGVAVEARYLLFSDVIKTLSKEVLAGDDGTDLVTSHVCNLGQALFNDMYLNWYDVPYVNFEKPWWSSSTVEDLTYDGKCFVAVGDVALSSLQATYCYYFNKQLTADYGIPDVYETVLEGKWTVDYLIQLTKDIYTDTNNSGDRDEEDFYGLCTNASSNANTYLWAFDSRIIAKTGDGKLEVVYNSEKTVDIVTKLVSMYNENVGISYNLNYVDAEGNTQFPYPRDMFLNNRTIFAAGQINMSLTHFRDMDSDYGIIPYPKLDEDQENYYAIAHDIISIMTLPVNCTKVETASAVLEALAYLGYQNVLPAYYESLLKAKYVRDAKSAQMIELIRENFITDIAYVYGDAFNQLGYSGRDMVQNKHDNLQSWYTSKEKAALNEMKKLIEQFQDAE